ncbi:MAG: ABC transporter ATP-binding protein [Elusimicrobiota bacterium]|nr:ABC transporter ATP-binding protein [Elusimicrobiota bacterium]
MNKLADALRQAWKTLRCCGLPDRALWALLASYYVLTPVSAAIDGLAWIQLVRLVAAGAAPDTGFLTPLLNRLGAPTAAAVGALFLAKGLLLALLTFIETVMGGRLRRDIQAACFEKLAHGRWDALSSQQVGRWTGALTEEAATLTKLVTSFFTAVYAVLTAGLLTGMAVALAPSLFIVLVAVGAPAWLFLKGVYGLQTRLSRSQAESRQGLAADLTETLSGLFQAKASGDEAGLTRRGLRRQDDIYNRELQLGGTLGLLTAFNPLGMGLILLGVAAWGSEGGLAALGGVGVLATRAAAQLNGLVNAIGNLTRLSGSIAPVAALVTVPAGPDRAPLGERLAAARLDAVTYSHGGRRVLDGVTLTVEPGRLLLVTGPSGAGKTTLVNLLAGLFAPEKGRVVYRGASGAEFDATTRRARIAYVAQEVHLFSGTVRENLDASGRLDDAALWRSLERAGAADFVRARGGLDAALAEAGRSLSGGERRRLAVARALAQEADLLALDEVTNGLDEASKASLVASIAELARELPVVAVTHDAAAFAPANPRSFVLAAAAR